MSATLKTGPLLTGPRASGRAAADLLHGARAQERAARISEAIASYEAAIAAAEGAGEPALLAEALRRLAVIRHHRNESDQARRLCHASYTVAHAAGNDVLAAEALNTLGGIDLETDAVADARRHFLRALELGGHSRELCARAEQNLGILANIQGDLDEALARYGRSLQAYHDSNDEHGRAIAYHNLGMASADRERFDEAEHYFRQSHEIAERAGDAYLGGLCLVNHAKVHVARERYEDARHDARAHLVHVAGKMAELEAAYLAVVREWGQSLESADTYTFGHCERVARLGVAVARTLGLDEHAQTTVRLGAYLHDLGKVRVPHETLSKPGPPTRDLTQSRPVGARGARTRQCRRREARQPDGTHRPDDGGDGVDGRRGGIDLCEVELNGQIVGRRVAHGEGVQAPAPLDHPQHRRVVVADVRRMLPGREG